MKLMAVTGPPSTKYSCTPYPAYRDFYPKRSTQRQGRREALLLLPRALRVLLLLTVEVAAAGGWRLGSAQLVVSCCGVASLFGGGALVRRCARALHAHRETAGQGLAA